MNQCKMSPLALGLSLGVLTAFTVIATALLSLLINGKAFVLSVDSISFQYEFSFLGCFIGGLFVFVHSFIVGALIAWLYNCFLGCCSGSCESKPKAKKVAKEKA